MEEKDELGLVIQTYQLPFYRVQLITFEDESRVIWTHVPSLFTNNLHQEISDKTSETDMLYFDDPNEMDNYGGLEHYIDNDIVKKFRDTPVPFEFAWFINEKGLENYLTYVKPEMAYIYIDLVNNIYPFNHKLDGPLEDPLLPVLLDE